jgi:choline dehydrogenase
LPETATDSYDYVIVGAGSAGCVLAARLTEDPGVTVLLLEAGPPDTADAIRMPIAFPTLFRSSHDWGLQTTPQHHADRRNVYWPRGRTLGGSSSTNAMIYIRCSPYDFDGWRDRFGCDGWGFRDLLPYFLKSEDQQRGASEHHATGGPLRVEDLRYKSPTVRAWVEAAKAAGLPANRDFNGESQDGVGFYQVTQRRGRRWSAADAYLRPALARPNLAVRTDAPATGVLVEGGRATGVRYRHGGVGHTVRARREVILSAGAIGSPHLLLLSGIGPARHLKEHGVEVILDSPNVGRGLQDHPNVPVMWHIPGKKAIWEGFGRLNAVLWQLLGRGPLASNLAEAGGFVRTSPNAPAPDLQYHVVAAPYLDQGLRDPNTRTLSVLISPLRIVSRGSVGLLSADPAHKPAVDPAYLADESDMELFLRGIRQSREIAAQPPLADLVSAEAAPGDDCRTISELREYIRATCATAHHPTSSLAMGSGDTAVDPHLRLRGLDGIRVVDASVLPEVPRGNTNAPVIALAERAADLILGRTPLPPAETHNTRTAPPGTHSATTPST